MPTTSAIPTTPARVPACGPHGKLPIFYKRNKIIKKLDRQELSLSQIE